MVTRREQLLEMLVAEEHRLARAVPELRKEVHHHISYLKGRLQDLDDEIDKTVRRSEAWRPKTEILRNVPRVGKVRGPKKAILAVAASILTAAYYVLRDQVLYRDLGPLYLARLDQDLTAQRQARRIQELGYEVQIRRAA